MSSERFFLIKTISQQKIWLLQMPTKELANRLIDNVVYAHLPLQAAGH